LFAHHLAFLLHKAINSARLLPANCAPLALLAPWINSADPGWVFHATVLVVLIDPTVGYVRLLALSIVDESIVTEFAIVSMVI